MSDYDPTTECALWVWRHWNLTVEMYNTERDAARAAMGIEDQGTGAVEGVQLADGRTIDRENWPLLDELREAEVARIREMVARMTPTTVGRRGIDITSPFDSVGVAEWKADEPPPAWVGRQRADA